MSGVYLGLSGVGPLPRCLVSIVGCNFPNPGVTVPPLPLRGGWVACIELEYSWVTGVKGVAVLSLGTSP